MILITGIAGYIGSHCAMHFLKKGAEIIGFDNLSTGHVETLNELKKIKDFTFIKGDLKSITISVASVIAKVTRDRMLDELHEKFPMYDFKKNKGYPTKKHIEAINEYGLIDGYRKTYGPVKDVLNKQ